MAIRKSVFNLTPTERDNFLEAVLTLKNTIANPAEPDPTLRISIYDQFVALHLYAISINLSGVVRDRAHGESGFFPWHRYYLLKFEEALQAAVPGVTLPYWDWTDPRTETVLFQDNFMGPHGTLNNGISVVQSGYFAFDAPGTGSNPTPSPLWWPVGLNGWRIRTSLDGLLGSTLRRNPTFPLILDSNVITGLNIANYEGSLPSDTVNGFRPNIELGPHAQVHGRVGGHMMPMSSPNDPLFFLHHCNVDRLWAMWQINGHQGPSFYPASGRPAGHNLNDPMWPWVGNLPGYSVSNVLPDIVIPNFVAEPVVTPNDVLDHRSLGYSYDSEIILGIALDQTGSMTGITPDPMLGSPDVTKWDAAKRGVEYLLQDCETIFASAEAYVVAGIETFRTGDFLTNVFTPIFTGPPSYGTVRNSGTTYNSTEFNTNIVLQSPSGGTPLAGALTDTENNLVRAPFGNLPVNDTRYLSILTDGMETASPLLNTLPISAFPNTIIFAMGFGVGSGWNGVDYTTIANIVSKGKTAPLGVTQIYHGENAGVIDKFFTDSLANAINYTPSVDPVYELFPGEHVDTPFDVTDSDSSFMITALGLDFSDRNWDFCLVRPDGSHCGDTGHSHRHADGTPCEGTDPDTNMHADGTPCKLDEHEDEHGIDDMLPFVIITRKRKGRCTVILKRNGAESSLWVGRWYFRSMYKMNSHGMSMYMPFLGTLLMPVGAPPVRGSYYSRLNIPYKKRQSVRAIPRTSRESLFSLEHSPSTNEDPCSLLVNIYSKTTIQPILRVDAESLFAGNSFDVILEFNEKTLGKISDLNITARLVAPKYSIGNTFADLKTISIEARKKYLNISKSNHQFNQLQYLADYEQKRTETFTIRDEKLIFKKRNNGTYKTHVENNIHPGVYRVSVLLEGTINKDNENAQYFSRIIHTTAALGIKPDPVKSKPSLRWINPNKFIISVTPTDKLGNIASPASMSAPVVTINGIAVKGKHLNGYTGEHQIEVTLIGKGLKINSDGKIIDGEGVIDTDSCEKLELKQGKKFDVGIVLNGKILTHSIAHNKKQFSS